MENNHQTSAPTLPTRGTRWKQNIAATLFVSGYVLVILESFFIMTGIWGPTNDSDVTANIISIYPIRGLLLPLFILLGMLILNSASVNRVVRNAVRIMTAAWAFSSMPILYLTVYFNRTDYDIHVLSSIINAAGLVLYITTIYALGIILNNIILRSSTRAWLGVILCISIILTTHNITNLLLPCVPESIHPAQVLFISSFYYKIFYVVLNIFLICAYNRFAKSELFMGNYDGAPAPSGTYSIINKYMGAMVIVWILFGTAMFFILRYADFILTYKF